MTIIKALFLSKNKVQGKMPLGKKNEDWLKELKDFQKHYGHCYVPMNAEYRDLFEWMQLMRQRRSSLDIALHDELDEMGMVWEMYDSRELKWIGKFNALEIFKREHGHCNIQSEHGEEYASLRLWMTSQRFREKSLATYRKTLLDDIGFLWKRDLDKLREEKWNHKFNILKAYIKEHGHSHIHAGRYKGILLSKWTVKLRQREDKLNPSRKKRLDRIGFRWTRDIKKDNDDRWMGYYRRLVEHKRKHGHLFVGMETADQQFVYWTKWQRSNKSGLTEERIEMLDHIGFDWRSDCLASYRWNRKYERLITFYKQYGHSDVPHEWVEDKKLARWVERQRKRKGLHSDDIIRRLDAVQFLWVLPPKESRPSLTLKRNKRVMQWLKQYDKLVRFYEKNGHCNVDDKNEYSELSDWVVAQRHAHNRNQLPPDRHARLEHLGFIWDGNIAHKKTLTQRWMNNYEQLKRIKKNNNYLDLSEKKSYTPLNRWLKKQMLNYRRGQLTNDRTELLRKLGFFVEKDDGTKSKVIEVKVDHKEKWYNGFKKLEKFKKMYGHMAVLYKPPDKALYRWLAAQLNKYKKGTLAKEYENRLTKLGVSFENPPIGASRWEKRWMAQYNDLKTFIDQNGHQNLTQNTSQRLYSWAFLQRAGKRKGELAPNRIKLLDDIQFIWDKSSKKKP